MAEASTGADRMLRITTVCEPGGTSLRLEGRIAGDGIVVLETECERWLASEQSVLLDFAHVAFIDSRGVELLRSLRRRGVEVSGVPPLIADMLDEAGES